MDKITNANHRMLHLSLKHEPFEVMISGEKDKEYRKPSKWILSRVNNNNNNYGYVKFVNGYGSDKPYFICEYKGFESNIIKEKITYSNGLDVIVDEGDIIISLGKIVESGNMVIKI